MRIWDIHPKKLCRNHLLGEHRELHGLWNILVEKKKGYSNHPETKRWKGKLKALYARHQSLVCQMKERGYNHTSPLKGSLAKGLSKQTDYINLPCEQVKILRRKKCNCEV
ncbi:MAG: pyrimidine dimer DNA glycosylase [Candidatus Omnitrophica bacterium]|nr:pyrimidine dimer DNA glycosylase [Candidatus Omnitrophota bacterium]